MIMLMQLFASEIVYLEISSTGTNQIAYRAIPLDKKKRTPFCALCGTNMATKCIHAMQNEWANGNAFDNGIPLIYPSAIIHIER